MIQVVDTLNTFAQKGQQDAVQPSEEQIFILSSSQLRDVISKTCQESLLEAQNRLNLLEDKIITLQNENSGLKRELEKLAENQLIQLRLINELRVKKEPQPMQRDRGEILRALIASNGGKMLAKEARKVMHLRKDRFSKLLAVCDFIETKPYHLDRRQEVIILKS